MKSKQPLELTMHAEVVGYPVLEFLGGNFPASVQCNRGFPIMVYFTV